MRATNQIDLKGPVAVVTDGTCGLGRHIAHALAQAIARVTVCGCNAPENLPNGMTFRAADIGDLDQAGHWSTRWRPSMVGSNCL